ncbi:peptidoglycan-binding domain-containing protein [Streptomyces sp. KN37]|uniref:peptidoglycan-binding domain-containing protein n=1 Tax=Streptomyces sp. KN37 TaxID=3090667 RepID=UPI002A7479F4|nr:peptidoglycan-binding domain-containing protein [Streptomyces sp. KN37]WPO70756.1 peptidoglycan-binding domain-containing protein [Streptomyces sp. KN37]
MTWWNSLDPAAVTVDPGGRATVRLRVRNTGDTVEEYRLGVVGAPAGWSRVEPEVLRLYPGSEGTAEISFAPPRSPDSTAGPTPFGIRVEPRENPQTRDVVEGQVTLTPFSEIRAELLPPTVVGRFRGRARVAVDNLGNTPLTASLTARDDADRLTFEVLPAGIQVAPGRAVFAKMTIRPQQVLWTGQAQPHPLTVSVRRSGDESAHELPGSFDQRPVLPRGLLALGSVLAALAVAFVVLWFSFAPKLTGSARENQAAPAPDAAPQGGEKKKLVNAPEHPKDKKISDEPDGGGGGGAELPGGDKDGSGGGGGGGGGVGGGGGGSDGSTAADRPKAPRSGGTSKAGPPWKRGYKADVVVEYAQHRLAALGPKNPCTLNGRVTPGVIDANTEASLICYQEAVVRAGESSGNNTAQIFATDDKGTLGRATLTSLWAQGIRADDVRSGADNWEVVQLQTAFWWASQAGISDDDLNRDRAYAEHGVAYFANGRSAPTTARYSSNTAAHIKEYQGAVGLPRTGVADSATLRAMVGGSVKNPGVVGR